MIDATSVLDAAAVRGWLERLQVGIADAASALDGQPFRADEWTRGEPDRDGGRGRTLILEGGRVFERAGIAFSHVRGAALPASASAKRPQLAGRAFDAMGVSLVMHPENPYCPTAHLNVRFFVATAPDAAPVWWFGGGMDLTPYYPFAEDAVFFHRACRDALTPFGAKVHPRCKKWCDEYFFLPHRKEPRGVGGIFFDDLDDVRALDGGAGKVGAGEAASGEPDAATRFAECFALARAVGEAFASAYLTIVERRRAQPFGERERDFQAYRRGRYVEFNLVWDRGTLFGLQSGGRTESILLSMPPVVKWRYDWQPEPGTPEAKLYEDFLPPRDWV